MGASKSVISQFEKAAEDGNALRKHVRGHGRNITILEDRYVVLVAKKKRNFTSSQIAANLATTTKTHISVRTISRGLKQVGFFVASHFKHAIVERDYAGVRNMLVGITKFV
ncbi:hypothetical protein TNCV_3561521 [Trichonephila clavipes]|nr:hypothetical protein TNCV_3561521 [Trichonephila clavipes]